MTVLDFESREEKHICRGYNISFGQTEDQNLNMERVM